MSKNDVAILGAGMHPWGKWGRNFAEYGVVAIKDAMKDAGLDWKDVDFVVEPQGQAEAVEAGAQVRC